MRGCIPLACSMHCFAFIIKRGAVFRFRADRGARVAVMGKSASAKAARRRTRVVMPA